MGSPRVNRNSSRLDISTERGLCVGRLMELRASRKQPQPPRVFARVWAGESVKRSANSGEAERELGWRQAENVLKKLCYPAAGTVSQNSADNATHIWRLLAYVSTRESSCAADSGVR